MAYNSVTDALARYVADFDLDALGAALGDELAAEVLGPGPYDARRQQRQITLERDDLACLLGAAAQNGAARFLSCAVLDTQIGGAERTTGDLDAVLATVRTALDLICTPADEAPQAERAERATRAVHLLGQLVNRWDGAAR